MKFYWIFLVLISSQSLPFLEALKLVDNGYENLYVVIQENIHESEELLDRIQDIFTEASTVLYIATRRRAYFKTLKVVIPKSWTKKDYYKTVSGLNSLTSHVKIGDSVNLMPPHTVGSGACGQAGLYLYLPLDEFVMQDGTTWWGPHAKVIVHEWGHLRWGLRDEYPTIKKPIGSNNAVNSGGGGDNVVNPGGSGENSVIKTDDDGGLSKGSEVRVEFYQANGVYKPVSCTTELNGYASMDCTSGIPDGNCDLSDTSKMIDPRCKYCPYQSQPYNISMMDRQYLDGVIEFCDEDDGKTTEYIRHNSQAENEQNLHCKGKSAWEIMREHEDFKDGNNPPMSTTYPPAVDIHWVQQSPDKARVFVLDSSGSMGSADRITKLYNMMQIIIEDVLSDGSWVSLIDFDSYAKLLTDFVQLNSTVTRQKLVSLVPSTANGGTCIPCGLDMAIQVISDFDVFDSTEEAEVILLSDGDTNGDMEAATQRCIDAGVVVTSIAFSHHADERLVNISERTGGRLLHIADNGTVSLTAAFTDIVSGGVTTDSQSATTMMNEQVSIMVNDPLNFAFTIDEGIGKDTTVSVISKSSSTLTIRLDGPSSFQRSKTGIGVQTLSLVVDGIIEQGPYIAQVTSSTAAEIEVMVTSKPTSPDSDVIRPIVRLSSNAYDFSGPSLPIMFVQLRKGESPVKKAIVKVQIENALGGKTCELELFDTGVGEDIQSGDGIYTASLLRECQGGNGRHSSKVLIKGTAETVATLYFSSKSAMIGTGVTPTTDSPTGTFERVAVGDAYTVSNYDPVIANEDITPPSRITDIQVIDIHSGLPSTSTTRNYTITWTAPGDDANVGQASFYEMRIADDPNVLRLSFLSADELNTGGSRMTPNISGKVERLVMTVSSDDSFTTTTNFAIVAVDEVGNRGPVSNIVPITVGSTSQFEVIEEECTDDCYAVLKDCGRDLTVRNGRVNLTNVLTTAGTEVPVMCNVGYELTGGTTLLCQENGTWSNTVTCEIIGCGGISIPNGGLEFPEGTNYSATAIVTCSDGYHITGTSSVTCMADGNWETPGTCEKNDCGNNETIAHGQVDFTNADTTYGQSVPVTCDTGYELFGGHTIVCLADGQWSKTVRCDIKDCERASISDGEVTHPSGTTYSARGVVQCDTGFEMVGTGFLECLESGLWNTESQCIIRDCGRTATVANGTVDFTNASTTFGQFVPVSCNIGFRRTGGTSIECLADGTWSKSVSCELVGCGSASIANGEIQFPFGTDYNDAAFVNCDAGFHLTMDDNEIVCLPSGSWNISAQCEINDCGNNATIAHGHIDFTNADTTFGQSVSVTCNTGYDLFGGHTIQCLADGSWSKTVSCVIKDCESASIANGVADHHDGTTYGSLANITCDPGYQLVGIGTITCLETGIWSTETKCVINDCGRSFTMQNGFVNFTNVSTTFGETLPIVCDIGYKHKDGSTIRCDADGNWKSVASCELVDCERASISGGEVTHPSGTTYSARAMVQCDTGFEIVGTGFLVCLESGLWNTETQCLIRDCGRSATVANGTVDFTNASTTFGQFVPVSCNIGFRRVGGTSIECVADGTWSKSVSCELVGCGSASLANGEIQFPFGTDYNDVAFVNCDEGFHLTMDNNEIVCLPTGNWNISVRCEINDCGINATIAHGQIDFTNADTTFGQSVSVTCNAGYDLVGGHTIQCLADGSWSKTVSCVIKDCEPPDIANGVADHHNGTTYGSVANITCDPGYQLEGTGTITCLKTGIWSTETKCVIKDCGASFTFQNGFVNFTNVLTTYGEILPIVCDIGYKHKDGSTIRCDADGNWKSVASCELVDCARASISGGEVTHPSGTKYPARAVVNCDTGYEMVGTGFLECLEIGLWSTESQCVIRDCGRSVTIANGTVDFTNASTTFGQFVPASCNIGFRRIGGTRIECLADGTWSKSVTCELVGCGWASIANGEILFPFGTDYNDVAFVNCDAGFHLTMENNEIICLPSGSWNISVQCEINDCGRNVTIQNGHANLVGLPTTYGQFIPVSCDTGYMRQGGTHIQCLSDGIWSSTVTCEIVDCEHSDIANGVIDFFEGTKYNAKAKLICDFGFRVTGTGFIRCMETGRWNNDSYCSIIDCGRTATVANGSVDFTNALTTFGQSVPVSCNIGFRRIGGASIECLADGTWSKTVNCELVGCGGASVANGEIQFPNGTDYNAVAFVDCSTGFHLTQESNRIVCLHSGKWNTPVRCEINDCGSTLIIPGGRADFGDGLPTTYGEYVTVTCHHGYRRQGGTHIQCLASGEWSSTVTCDIVDCGYPDISNGALDFSNGTKYNSKAKLNCDEGYRLYGTGFIECFETGRWSNHSICIIIDCGRDVTVAHGIADFNDGISTYGHSVPVICDTGYEINGNHRIECLANGMWSSLPTCQITECDTDVEIKNGRANFTGRQTTFGVSISVVCDAGFQLKGNESITCLANRTWSEFPVCEQIDEGLSTGLKVVSIVAGSFGLIVLIIIGLLTRSFVINARTRAPERKSKITHKQRKYMANDTIVEPPPDYDMESVDWYLYDNKKFQHFDQHYTDDIYY